MKNFLKTHQQALALTIGYLLVAILAFGVGRITTAKFSTPQIRVEAQQVPQTSAPISNYTPNQAKVQSATTTKTTLDCSGKIKGSSSFVYHLPGDAFYDRTTKPVRCFDTEAEAQAAGFRKSSK